MLNIITTQSNTISFLSIREICRLKELSRAARECLKWLHQARFQPLLQIAEKEFDVAFVAAAELGHTKTLFTLCKSRALSGTLRSEAIFKAASNGHDRAIQIILDSNCEPFPRVLEFPRVLDSVNVALERNKYSTAKVILSRVSRFILILF